MMPMTNPAARVNGLGGKGAPGLNTWVAICLAFHGPVETTRAGWAEIAYEVALANSDCHACSQFVSLLAQLR
jgi:hypothetical protein